MLDVLTLNACSQWPPIIIHVEGQKVEISTSRLLIRGAREGDAHQLHNGFSDTEVMRYWSTLPHSSLDDTTKWVQKMKDSEQNGVTDFVFCLKPDLTPIGKGGIWQDDEIGFMIHRAHWHKGLAHEALSALLSYFFEQKGKLEIVADTDPRNTASKALLQKLGFVVYDFREKTYQIGEEWVDSTYLKLTKEQWEAQA